MTTIYIAKYTDGMYPEDNEIFGAYLTVEEANQRLNEELENAIARDPGFPDKNTKKKWNYSYDEVELTATPEQLRQLLKDM